MFLLDQTHVKIREHVFLSHSILKLIGRWVEVHSHCWRWRSAAAASAASDFARAAFWPLTWPWSGSSAHPAPSPWNSELSQQFTTKPVVDARAASEDQSYKWKSNTGAQLLAQRVKSPVDCRGATVARQICYWRVQQPRREKMRLVPLLIWNPNGGIQVLADNSVKKWWVLACLMLWQLAHVHYHWCEFRLAASWMPWRPGKLSTCSSHAC